MAKDRQTTAAEPAIPKSYSERRKLKKVQVERHRRERINRSMGALRDLLCQGRPDMAADIDRAQILELAVSVIRRYQHQPAPIPSVQQPTTSASYRAGYSGAANVINTHLDSACVDTGARMRLMNHLATYQDIRYNMTSPAQRIVSGGAFLPVQTIHDVTHKTGPLFVDCGPSHDVKSRDTPRDYPSADERMDNESPQPHDYSRQRLVDENNNNDMWRPW